MPKRRKSETRDAEILAPVPVKVLDLGAAALEAGPWHQRLPTIGKAWRRGRTPSPSPKPQASSPKPQA